MILIGMKTGINIRIVDVFRAPNSKNSVCQAALESFVNILNLLIDCYDFAGFRVLSNTSGDLFEDSLSNS